MLGRIVLASALLVALGAPSALAGGPGFSLWHHYKKCDSAAQVSQCALNFTTGNRNIAIIEQTTKSRHSTQLGVIFQDGNNNQAYTGQVGKNQLSLTTQNGNNNGGFTYQQGSYNLSTTTQDGNGTWAATSSIGNGTYSHVTLSN